MTSALAEAPRFGEGPVTDKFMEALGGIWIGALLGASLLLGGTTAVSDERNGIGGVVPAGIAVLVDDCIFDTTATRARMSRVGESLTDGIEILFDDGTMKREDSLVALPERGALLELGGGGGEVRGRLFGGGGVSDITLLQYFDRYSLGEQNNKGILSVID